MVIEQNFRIIGTGSYLPAQKLTADDVDVRTSMPSGWTRLHVGVETRYECVAPETLVTMGREAIESAMSSARIGWEEIDYIIDCSTSKFRPIPCNAVHFQHAFGNAAKSIPCVDVQSTCLGSILAINTANAMFATGGYRNILIVASESALTGVNWSDPESAGLIGDGAGALVLTHAPSRNKLAFAHETYAEHIDLCKIEGGGHHLTADKYDAARSSEFRFSMNGRAIFKVALKHLPPMVKHLQADLQDGNPGSLDHLQVIPHQASPKAVEIIRRLVDVPSERYHVAVAETGNLAAASIPVMIDRLRKQETIHSGDTVMLLGTSAGYSQAAMIFEV